VAARAASDWRYFIGRHLLQVVRGKVGAVARQLLDSIDTTTLVGLRDRAMIGVMAFAFARTG
jgi:hypothetical protein